MFVIIMIALCKLVFTIFKRCIVKNKKNKNIINICYRVRRKKMHLPDILWNALTKAISDAFKNSLLVPVLLEFKGTKDVSMFV